MALDIKDRISSKKRTSGKFSYLVYLHLCKSGCGKEMWKTASEELKATGYCRSCAGKRSQIKRRKEQPSHKCCKDCKRTLSIDNFHKAWDRTKTYKSTTLVCKACINLKKYKINYSDYIKMLDDQDNKCAICKCVEYRIDARTRKIKPLSVDHCHNTGKVRGLLCTACNMSLGGFRDNIETLNVAIEYLKNEGFKNN